MKSNEDGTCSFGIVPRDAKLSAFAQTHQRVDFGAEQREIAMHPITLDFHVRVPDGENVPQPRGATGGRVLSDGTSSGEMVFGPHPGRDEPLVLCAKAYGPQEYRSTNRIDELTLAKGSGCPLLPSPSSSPDASHAPALAASPPRHLRSGSPISYGTWAGTGS